MRIEQVLAASRSELIIEIERLRALLWHAGICADCSHEINHDIIEPFASCECGTSEATVIPVIPDLRHQLYVTSFLLFKMAEGV